MQRKLQQQSRTIKYIKQKYKEKTGEEVTMPKTWEDYLDIQADQMPSNKLPQPTQQTQVKVDFQLAIDRLQLPVRINQTKLPLTSFQPSNKLHMVESITLNHFRHNGFSKQLLRDLMSRIIQMRCLRSLQLKDNGIDQQCAEEIQTLFSSIKRIVRIDLSQNEMGKTCMQIISRNFNHLQWIDLSRNRCIFEASILANLLNSIRINPKLYHICMDFQNPKNIKTFVSYLKLKPQIHSFSPIDSKIDEQSMSYITHGLQSSSHHLYSLNFSFCYLEQQPYSMLLKALANNTTLVQINLNNNNLADTQAILLCRVLQFNISLLNVQLAGNLLSDQFLSVLSATLRKNDILQHINLGYNHFTTQGAAKIYQCLSQSNDTVQSFGDLDTNRKISIQMLQKLKKVLRINRISKTIRAEIFKQQANIGMTDVTSRQTSAFLQAEYQEYQLLVPIAISNPLQDEPYPIHIWSFD